MRSKVIKKAFSLIAAFMMLFQQTGFAQGIGQLEFSKHLTQTNVFFPTNGFSPVHLRSFSYNPATDKFLLFLDKGDVKEIKDGQIKTEGQELLRYFLTGVSLADSKFWVNLRPDTDSQIIDPELARTDFGKILLEADLQLKKDVAMFTSPQTAKGKEYWDKLYKKAGELFGAENVDIPTLTRPWIVPGEVIIRETADSAYIYKATLKVMLEQDHLKNSVDYKFDDPRLKQLNEYSSQLIREKIIPQLTKEVNSSAKYSALRQVFYSLVLSRWFKAKFAGKQGVYSKLINTGKLNGLTSQQSWSKATYYNAYKESFTKGEYNIKQQVNTPSGPVIRQYFSGGADLTQNSSVQFNGRFNGSSPVVSHVLSRENVILSGRTGLNNLVPSLSSAISANEISGETGNGRVVTSSAVGAKEIRTDFTVPEGQKEGFFTQDYQSYNIGELFNNPVDKIPTVVVRAVQKKLDRDVKEGRLLSAVVLDTGATDIDIHVTHRYGELNAAVQRLILEAMKRGCIQAQQLGLLRADINAWNLKELAQAMRVKHREHSITERGSEPVVIAKLNGAGIGAANLILYHEFFMPGSTPLVKLGFVPVKEKEDKKGIVRGFRAIVRRTDDVFKGKTNGDVWEFEFSSEATVDGVHYNSVNQAQELLALASQPNDYVITDIYAVEGSIIDSTEPIVSVVYQPVYGERADQRTLNPTFLFRSQSGGDAVGGIAGMFYNANFVPGGINGERFVSIKPVTLAEARKAPEDGMANAVVYGWMSEGNGVISRVVDHVGLNPPALSYIRKLARWLAGIMKTHPDDQPYMAPFAAEERVTEIRKQQAYLFKHAPKETELDSVMDEVEALVAADKLLSIDIDKADMGGDMGHNYVPDYMSAVYRATLIQAQRHGKFVDGNIIGFFDKGRLKIGKTTQVGDDGEMVTIGDKSRNSADGHQIKFTGFTRAYLIAVASGKKPYGLAQDYQGKEAKAAKANPYFYSRLDQEFFDILREVMPKEYMDMVDNMETGWKKWKATNETVKLPDHPFSGNVSQQGIGTARLLLDFANGKRQFGILAGDKMGPAGINRPIREGVYAALNAGQYENGLVFEIWDAKAFNEDGNIPLNKLPGHYSDIADAVDQLKDREEQNLIKSLYGADGLLKQNRTVEDSTKLAALLKKAGYVPTERIFLDAQQDKEAIYAYLADSDRFNIKQVWSKKKAGWDINNFQEYLLKPILGSSVTKLGILAGGEYVGKDDPATVGDLDLMKYIWKYLAENPVLLQGDMNGSHWLGAIPTKFKYAVANVDSHPIFVGLQYTLDDTGKIINIEDVFSNKEFNHIRNRMFKFNFLFKWIASLGGQFAPYCTDARTVEAAYPLAKLLRQLQASDSPFLVRNKPPETRITRPIGIFEQRRELFDIAAANDENPLPKRAAGGGFSSSSGIKDEAPWGGIDFTVIKPMGIMSGINLSLPKLSKPGNINLDSELSSIQKMVSSGISPNDDRLENYVAACYQRGQLKQYIEGIVSCVAGIYKLNEKEAEPASNGLKKITLVLDSVR